MNNRKLDIYKILFVINLFLFPILLSFFIVIINNYEKFDSLFKTFVILGITVCLLLLIVSFFKLNKDKRVFSKNHLYKKIVFASIFIVFAFEIGTLVKIVYYDDTFKNWLITTSLGSINHKELAKKIYSKYTIDEVSDDTPINDELINFDVDYKLSLYKNEYEKEVLEHNPNDIYKIFKIEGKTSATGSNYVGYVTVVYNPANIHLAKSVGSGTDENAYGQKLDVIAKNNNALVAMNAGGFYDPNWSSNGGIPHGDVFINGELDSTYARANFGGGIIGFTKDNKLVLKRMSTEEAIEMGIKDAVDWGPYLIVDGDNKYKNRTEYWEVGRSAIGQREDGIVLMIVIDNLQKHSKGVSYSDLANLFERYGAINAASLDGGTSTMLWEKGEYINSPWNGVKPTFRRIPNAWIVTE